MISAFGPRAQAFAEGVGDLDAVIADVPMLGPARAEAVRRRELGRPFYGMVLYEEPRALTTLGYAWQVLSQISDFDMRRAALDQLGEGRLMLGTQPAQALWGQPAAAAIDEFLSLADRTLVRSFAEAERLSALSGSPRSIEPVLSEPAVPPVRPGPGVRPGVVIWAPQRASAFVAWYAFALAEFFGAVTCVTAGGDVPSGLPARFVHGDDADMAAILAGAQCALCPDPDDPGAAVAFARLGFGVAAPLASGAHEYVRDVVSFRLNQQREVEIAVKIAIGRPASLRELPSPPA